MKLLTPDMVIDTWEAVRLGKVPGLEAQWKSIHGQRPQRVIYANGKPLSWEEAVERVLCYPPEVAP